MARSLDELIDFLLDEIALSGQHGEPCFVSPLEWSDFWPAWLSGNDLRRYPGPPLRLSTPQNTPFNPRLVLRSFD